MVLGLGNLYNCDESMSTGSYPYLVFVKYEVSVSVLISDSWGLSLGRGGLDLGSPGLGLGLGRSDLGLGLGVGSWGEDSITELIQLPATSVPESKMISSIQDGMKKARVWYLYTCSFL